MIAEVRLWGRRIGAVSMVEGRDHAAFQYEPAFVRSGIQPSPLAMPLHARVHEFPALPRSTFHGLPGLLADSLPDKFGNALIDAWLATRGRTPQSFNADYIVNYMQKCGQDEIVTDQRLLRRLSSLIISHNNIYTKWAES